jgi:hypothetical protein
VGFSKPTERTADANVARSAGLRTIFGRGLPSKASGSSGTAAAAMEELLRCWQQPYRAMQYVDPVVVRNAWALLETDAMAQRTVVAPQERVGYVDVRDADQAIVAKNLWVGAGCLHRHEL